MNNSFADRLRTRAGVAIVALTVAAASFFLYLPSIAYDFVWGDRELLGGHLTLDWVGDSTSVPGAGLRNGNFGSASRAYHPTAMLTFRLDRRVGGGKPWAFHLTNVLLGSAAAVFVCLGVWELLHSGVWAGLAGLIFAFHPAHVEAIASISGRGELLLAFFMGFCWVALLRALRKRDGRWLWGVAVCFLLGLLSKESAALFPFVAVSAPLFIQSRFSKGYWLLLFVLAIVGAVYLGFRAPGFVFGSPKAIQVANAFGFYIRMFLWPFDHRVKIPPDPAFLKVTPLVIYAVIFVFLPPLAALRRRYRVALWAYFWTLIFLLPAGNVLFPESAAERLLFLPSMGLTALLVVFISRLLVSHHRVREVAGAGIVLGAMVWAGNSALRLRVWRDDKTFFSAMIREAPQLPEGYLGLADALRNVLPDSAIKLYNRAILIDQGLVPAHINIARLYREKGDYRRALHHLRLADELKPGCATVQVSLGETFMQSGQPDSAIAAFQRALCLDPTSRPALLYLAALLLVKGDSTAAAELARRAVKLAPGDSGAERLYRSLENFR